MEICDQADRPDKQGGVNVMENELTALRAENARLARELGAAVRKGRWNAIRGDYGNFYTGQCSECGCEPLRGFAHSPWAYCPNCGAKMGTPANVPSPGDGERGGGTDGKAD